MEKNLKLTNKTVINIFKELETNNLIKQISQGKGKAYKIYVIDIFEESSGNFTPVVQENLHMGTGKNTSQVVENLHTNKIYNKYSNKIYPPTKNNYIDYTQRKYSDEELEKFYCN